MKYNLVFIHWVYVVKIIYTTNDNIPSCYDNTIFKVNTFFSAKFFLINVPSITHMEPISSLTGNKISTYIIKLQECKNLKH